MMLQFLPAKPNDWRRVPDPVLWGVVWPGHPFTIVIWTGHWLLRAPVIVFPQEKITSRRQNPGYLNLAPSSASPRCLGYHLSNLKQSSGVVSRLFFFPSLRDRGFLGFREKSSFRGLQFICCFRKRVDGDPFEACQNWTSHPVEETINFGLILHPDGSLGENLLQFSAIDWALTSKERRIQLSSFICIISCKSKQCIFAFTVAIGAWDELLG